MAGYKGRYGSMEGRKRRNSEMLDVTMEHAVDRRGTSGLGSLAMAWML